MGCRIINVDIHFFKNLQCLNLIKIRLLLK
nr:MAG TPA: hypothetical protein [Caudoviricetes sp.]